MMNMMNMMKQAQNIQKRLKDAQEELNHMEISGEAANGAVKIICDRIKVPANQVALINASSGFSNGTELREGEIAKYRSFRRFLNATLYDFAAEIGLQVDYTIENEPLTNQGQQIEQA